MRKNSIRRRSLSENASFYILLAPFAVLFFVFTVLPVLSSIVLSFFTYDMISTPHWTGFSNYLRMFVGDEVFPKAIVNTLKFAIVTGPISFFLSFLLGWLVNELRPMARNALAFLFYAPTLAGSTTLIWKVAFSGDSYGYVNSLLLSSGLIDSPINWFQNTTYNTAVLIMVQLWASVGVSFLANISGLQNVNAEMYEAGCAGGIRTGGMNCGISRCQA